MADIFLDQEDQEERQPKEENEVYPDDLSGDFNEDESQILVNPAEPTHVSLFKIVSIIIKTIIGAHIVLIPYCASILGWALFPIVLIIIIGIHHYTSILLLKSKNLSRHSNFSTILFFIWPRDSSKIFGAGLMMINNLAFCILEFVLIKNTIVRMASNLNGEDIGSQWQYFIILIMGVMEAPFIFIKRIEKLKIFSIIGVAGIIVFILGNIILFILEEANSTLRTGVTFQPWPYFGSYQYYDSGEKHEFTVFNSWLYLPTAISILIFALNFHMNFFPIYKGLKNPTDQRMKKASLAGLSVTAVLYSIIGFIGYRIAGRNFQTNILVAFRYHIFTDNDQRWMWIYWIINIAYIVSVMFNVVLMFFTCKNNFVSIINICRRQYRDNKKKKVLIEQKGINQNNQNNQNNESNSEEQVHSNKSSIQISKKINRQYKFFTAVLYLVFVVASLLLTRLSDLFSILGALCSTTIVIILPCLFYVMLIHKQNQPKKTYLLFFCCDHQYQHPLCDLSIRFHILSPLRRFSCARMMVCISVQYNQSIIVDF